MMRFLKLPAVSFAPAPITAKHRAMLAPYKLAVALKLFALATIIGLGIAGCVRNCRDADKAANDYADKLISAKAGAP